MRWTQEDIDNANSRDIAEVADDLGMKLVKRGPRYWTQCPWHDDGSPSLQLGGKDAYRCLCTCYVCGKSHTVLDLVMEVKECSFSEAVAWTLDKSGIEKGKSKNENSASTKPLKPMNYGTLDEVRPRVSLQNSLSRCLQEFFPREVVIQVTMMYLLGCDYEVCKYEHTLFPTIDGQGRCHDIKVQQYDTNPKSPRFCHSMKGGTYWVGSKVLGCHDRDRECLFGEHLLALRPSDVVALVESPKNAVVGACARPDLVWVATGNKGMLKRSVLAPLAGRQVLVFPDRDATDEWKNTLDGMQDLALFVVSDALKDWGGEKSDIADLILARRDAECIKTTKN